ncbi:MAG: 4'-phosphopantetheinyl transferase superfamily protein [Gammaproteobacteria bacterium]|nr:4'-phosphopantetheinyl transferase superfamily protein [Gammaproteobacteria bacterium]
MEENFSGQVKLSCCRILPIITLTADEEKIVKDAVERRCFEFSAGRRCARKCLGYSGITDFSLLRGEYGEPVWPQGFTGSITHYAGMAFAVSLPRNQGLIGIDLVDLNEKLPCPHLILDLKELDTKAAVKVNNPEILLFSLKESVIKILSPALQKYIEFTDIKIILGDGVAEITYRDKAMDINLYWFTYGAYAFTVAVKNEAGGQ